MSPWWSRPTADSGQNDSTEKQDNPADNAPVSAASPLAESRFLEPEPYEPPSRDSAEGEENAEVPAAEGAEWAEGEEEEMMEPVSGEASFADATDSEPAEGEAAEGGERPGRRRRTRGGRRRRGRGNGEAQAALPAEEPAPRAERERFERPERERPERGERPERERPERERGERPRRIEELPPVDLESLSRQIILSMPERAAGPTEEKKIAIFCDLENIALGVRDSEIKKFDINLVLERLLEKGKIIVKRAYADWERYSDYKRTFHEAAIELIDIPQRHYSGKNSADIKMVVDAMDLSYSKEHLDTFVLLSGDSDFSPLVSKLKENNKYVIGIGVKNSSSALLIDNCDEFIYYEDVWRDQQKAPEMEGLSKKQSECFGLVVESIQALTRENKDVLWGSMIKQTMQRKKPSFNEGYYGYSTFSELLEDAERHSILKLKKDQRSGSYIVTGFAPRK